MSRHGQNTRPVHYQEYYPPPSQPATQQPRAQVPIHTAFFSNIEYTTPQQEFDRFARQFGDIAHTYSLIEKKGMAFVTYYDIRDAERAVADAKDKMLGGRQVKTNFARKGNAHCDPRAVCAALLVKVSDPARITMETLHKVFSRYGEVSRINPLDVHGQFCVKFYNIRSCQTAFRAGPTITTEHGPITIDFKTDEESVNDVPPPNNTYQAPAYGNPQPNYQASYPPPQYQQPQYGQQYQPPQYGQGPNYGYPPAGYPPGPGQSTGPPPGDVGAMLSRLDALLRGMPGA